MARIKKLVTPDNPDTPEDETVYEEVEVQEEAVAEEIVVDVSTGVVNEPTTSSQGVKARYELQFGTIREDF